MSFENWTNERITIKIARSNAANGVGDRVVSSGPFVTIGSSESADVVLESTRIPPVAFCVCLDARNRLWGSILVRPNSSRYHDGFRRIDPSKEFRIGEYRLVFHTEDCPVEPLSDCDRRCVLKWRTGDESRISRLRPNRPILLGRETPSQLVIDHKSVSAAHCCLLFDGNSLWVIDVGSTNKIRTIEGAGDVLCLSDRKMFAAGRVQFKVAIPTQLVPARELQQLRLTIAQHEVEAENLAALREELEKRQVALNCRIDDLRCEQDAWIRRRKSQEADLENRLTDLINGESALADRAGVFEQYQQQQTEELERIRMELKNQSEELESTKSNLLVRQQELEAHWLRVADEIKSHKMTVRREQVELQRRNELSVVQRIRTQRELKERESELDEREKQLIRREIQIEAAQRRLPRDVSSLQPDLGFPSESISDSTVLAANDFVEILDQALDHTDNRTS